MMFLMARQAGLRRKDTAMNDNPKDGWITRRELAGRYGLPVKTLAQWASKGTGPPYAKFGRHVRYRLSDVFAWEAKQLVLRSRDSA
jgi:predicted DNA-binding transcriptional regulator AlpA